MKINRIYEKKSTQGILIITVAILIWKNQTNADERVDHVYFEI